MLKPLLSEEAQKKADEEMKERLNSDGYLFLWDAFEILCKHAELEQLVNRK